MADAKITLETLLEDSGLQALNTELAKGSQEVKQMKSDLKDLEKANKGATDEAIRLKAAIQNQEHANKSLSQAIKENVKDLNNATDSTESFVDSLKSSLKQGLNTSELGFGLLAGAAAGLAVTLATAVVGAVKDTVAAITELGLTQQQAIARLSEVQSVISQGFSGEEIHALFDATARDLEISTEEATKFGLQLMNAGISAQNASAMIGLCSDASYRLGGDASKMQIFADVFNSIAQRGEVTTRQLKSLQEQGVDLDKAFKGLGMNGADAMKAVEDGTLDAETAINTLVKYMDEEYGGATQRAKNNTLSSWGDVEGNLATIMATIGASIYDAFNKSGIIQALVDITQAMLDLIQGDGVGIFKHFGDVASMALGLIANALNIITTGIKVVMLVAKEMADTFKSIGAKIANFLSPILTPLGQIWDVVSALVRTLGKEIKGSVDIAFTNTFGGVRSNVGGDYDGSQNNIHAQAKATSASRGAESSNASSKVDAKKELSELEQFAQQYRAVFQTIPRMKDLFATGEEMETAKANVLAQLQDIKTQGDAILNSDTFGTDEEVSGIAKLIGKSPEMLAEELALKNQSITEFFDSYIAKQNEAVMASEETTAGVASAWGGISDELQNSFSKSLTSFFDGMINGSKRAGTALADFANSIIQGAIKIGAQWLILAATFAAFGDPQPGKHASAALFGMFKGQDNGMGGKYASGGFVTGPGTARSDSIPAMLSNGEYVINAAAVDRFGRSNLDAINAGRVPESIKNETVSVGSSNNVSLNISAVDASSFGAFLDNGGLDTIRQALFDNNRSFAVEAGVW